jgi:hypothetical protein
MRARHRHFNAAHAGATAIFDSRFMSGFSDGASVDTWVSRSGSNDISQATAANRPTYETNEINGNPSVYWDGGANDELTFASALSYSNTSIVTVYKNEDATNGSVVFARNNNSSDYIYFTTNTVQFQNSVTSTRTHNLGNVFLIGSGIDIASTSVTAFANGTAATTTSGGNVTFTCTGIGKYGAGTAPNTQGHLGLAIIANVAWNDPLRRRVEHAAAYSFKISCN